VEAVDALPARMREFRGQPELATRAVAVRWAVVVDGGLPAGLVTNAAASLGAAVAALVPAVIGDSARDASVTSHPGLPWLGCTILRGDGTRCVPRTRRSSATRRCWWPTWPRSPSRSASTPTSSPRSATPARNSWPTTRSACWARGRRSTGSSAPCRCCDEPGSRPGEAQEVSLASLRSGIGVIAPRSSRPLDTPAVRGRDPAGCVAVPLLASQAN
jgi:hypothetical protein